MRGPFTWVDPVEVYADARVSVMTLEDKVASLFMLHRVSSGCRGSPI